MNILQSTQASKEEHIKALDWWANLPHKQRTLLAHSVNAKDESIGSAKVLLLFKIKNR